MSQRSIAQQISSVSITLIAGLLLLALFAVATTVLIRNTFVEYRATAKTTLFANAVFEDLFEARMAALKWRLTYTPDSEAEFIENIEEILIAEAELKESTGGAHGFDEVYEQLDADLNAYRLEFEALQGLHQQYEAVEAELRTSGLAARQALSEIMSAAHANENSDAVFRAGQAQESLMLARYYLERFRRTEAPSDLDRSRNEASAAVQTLDILTNALSDPAAIAQVASVRQSLDEFISKTTALSGTVTGQMTARETMDVLGPKMVSDVEMVIDRVVDRQNTLGPRGQSISFWAVVTLCIASVLIVGIGWRIARLHASRITQDINEAVTTMSRIAEGDLDAEVKGAENENEIGRMAQALEVFKAKGKEAIEATEREKAAEAKREQEERERRQQQKEKELAEQQRMEAARKAMISELSMSLGEVVSAASAGNFSKRVDADFSDQELVALADDVNRLVDSVDTGLCATVEVLERVGQGDLTRHMNGDFQGAFKTLQNNTNDMIDALKELIGGIGASSANLTASSSELRDTSDVLSKQAEQNAASLEETSAALEELTSSIKQVSQNVQEASENAQVARDTATSSSKVAGDAADAMSRISQASEEITQVVSVINDIAFQINLLALNAGVEAARAGDAGRGFSVVASEVRQLAQRASDSAKEINEVIGKSEQAVAEGVAKVTGARTSLEQISQSVVEVSARISEVSHAITEQVQGVGEVNVAVSQIDQNTQRQAASFEEVTAASGLLSQEAQGLQQSIVRFDIGSKTEYARDPGPTVKKAALQKPRVAVSSGNLAVAEDSWEEF